MSQTPPSSTTFPYTTLFRSTKDEIGEAIVELRLAELSARRQRWNEAGSPKDRLCACVQDVFENKDFLAEHGCRSEEHTSELQSHVNLVCRLLLEKKKSTATA